MFSINDKLKYLLLLLIGGYVGAGCNLVNPTEPVPTYVHIDSFEFNRGALPSTITTSHQINSVWAYYNNSPIGVFDLPATIPVQANGSRQLTLFPGIAVDGQNNFLTAYPFYRGDTFTLTLQPGKVVNHIPKTSYYTTPVFFTIADFELFSKGFKLAGGSSEITITKQDSLKFEGSSGLITLNAATNDTMSEDSSVVTFTIPQGVDAYIEFNYKNTAPFSVGLRPSYDNFVQTIYLNGAFPSDHWQKFYLAVKDFAAQYKADHYQFFIKAYLPAGQTSGKVLIDNIQLVHF